MCSYFHIVRARNVLSERTRGSGHKLKHRNFHLIMRKMIFTLKVVEHWNRLPKICGISSGATKSLPRCDPVQPAPGEPASVGALD